MCELIKAYWRSLIKWILILVCIWGVSYFLTSLYGDHSNKWVATLTSNPGVLFGVCIGIATLIGVFLALLQLKELATRTTSIRQLLKMTTQLLEESERKNAAIKMLVFTPTIGNLSALRYRTEFFKNRFEKIKNGEGQESEDYNNLNTWAKEHFKEEYFKHFIEYDTFRRKLLQLSREAKIHLEVIHLGVEHLEEDFYKPYRPKEMKGRYMNCQVDEALNEAKEVIKSLHDDNKWGTEALPLSKDELPSYHLILSDELGKAILFVPLVIPKLSTPQKEVEVFALLTKEPHLFNHLQNVYDHFRRKAEGNQRQ